MGRRAPTEPTLVEQIPPLAEALTTIEHQMVFDEAKRQYDALVLVANDALRRLPHASGSHSPVQVDLAQHYRLLFEDATKDLKHDDALKLLNISLAHKTRKRVMLFLGVLGDEFEWAEPLRRIVRVFGRDSGFEDDNLDSSEPEVKRKKRPSRAVPNPYTLRSLRPARPTWIPRRHFVIPTLPLAFPVEFLVALGANPTVPRPIAPSLLCYPAMLRVALNENLKSVQLNSLLQFDERTAEDETWIAFFKHLLQGREPLVKSDLRPLKLSEYGDYNQSDLVVWITGWFAGRPMTEKRKMQSAEPVNEASPKKRQKTSSTMDCDQVVGTTDMAKSKGTGGGASLKPKSKATIIVDKEQGADNVNETESGEIKGNRKKRVSFNKAASVREVPPRATTRGSSSGTTDRETSSKATLREILPRKNKGKNAWRTG